MSEEEINFIKYMCSKTRCTLDEGKRLYDLFSKYINPARASVLTPNCGSCITEMVVNAKEYIDKYKL